MGNREALRAKLRKRLAGVINAYLLRHRLRTLREVDVRALASTLAAAINVPPPEFPQIARYEPERYRREMEAIGFTFPHDLKITFTL